jgi:DNA-binding SARP family transcriptional activator/energy-coupling factor transporter ATP-binding protein EcfA2
MVFGVLGPLQVRSGSAMALTRGTKRDVLLAILLGYANQPVGVDELVEAVWADPPRSAVANIHTYVNGLRGWLPSAPSGDRLTRSRNGYLLAVEPDELDASAFCELAARAEDADCAGCADEALGLLSQALDLWRGPPLSGLPAMPVWQAPLRRLAALRRSGREQRIRLWVERANYAPATEDLRELIAEDPFCEELWRQLMVTLALAGQQAAALRAYRQARALLVAELGIEPGPALQQAHAEVLGGHAPQLIPPEVAGVSGRTGDAHAAEAPASGMWQLPPDTADFTGRAAELATLTEWLTPGAATPAAPTETAAPAIVVVVGQPGVGKTTLAVHVAHLLRPRFPDGQLYLELDGTGDPERSPSEVLAELLRTLGVTGAALPESLAGRAALYRSLMRGRRVLVLLDNAAGSAQVTALLPPDGGSAVLVTSRRRICAPPGGRVLDLGVLDPEEGRDLLRALIGPDRAEREPADVDRIVEACGRLPLGIRIAGARLAGRQPWSLRAFAERLRDRTHRLTELSLGDLGVRASFELSARSLPPAAVLGFRGLGLLGPVEVAGWVVGRLLDEPDADAVLDALVDASLVQVTGPDASGQPRYRLHDLLRCYARESAEANPAALGREAIARALSGWLGLAELAADRLPGCVLRAGPGASVRWRPDRDLRELALARPLAWFDAERGALLNAVELAAATGLDELAWELAVALVPYFDHRGLLDDWQRGHEAALVAVRASGNLHGEAALLRGLGQVELYRDRYRSAYRSIDLSRRLSQRLGDGHGEAIAIAGIGTIERVAGDSARALAHYRRALAMFKVAGNRHAEAQTRNAIGAVYRATGALGEAWSWLDQALRLAASLDDPHRVACVLTQLGELHLAGGSADRARRTLLRAVALFEELDDTRCGAYALEPLARALAACDEAGPAMAALDRAATVLRAAGDRRGETIATRTLGALHGTERTARSRAGRPSRGDGSRPVTRRAQPRCSGDVDPVLTLE